MRKDTQITVRVPNSLREELRILAMEDNRPLASYVTLVLKQHVEHELRKKENADAKLAHGEQKVE